MRRSREQTSVSFQKLCWTYSATKNQGMIHCELLRLTIASLLLLCSSSPSAIASILDVGDNTGLSSGLIHVNSNTSLYLSLINPSSGTNVQVFQSFINPPPVNEMFFQINIPKTTITSSKELYHIYLLPKSTFSYRITYKHIELPAGTTSCPPLAQIRTGSVSACLHTNGTWQLNVNINTSGLYPVYISVNTALTIQGQIKIKQVYYVTTNLFQSSECSSLMIDNPSCLLKPVKNDSYIVVLPNKRASVSYVYGDYSSTVDHTPSSVTISTSLSSSLLSSPEMTATSNSTIMPTATPTRSDGHASRAAAIGTSVSISVIIIIAIPALIICFGGYYIKRKQKSNTLTKLYNYMTNGRRTKENQIKLQKRKGKSRTAHIRQMKDIFKDLTKLTLESNGLMHHCSQYGVTLIIPEGAVQQPAQVWFGACLFSDRFKFGDYIPVTPIVWMYVNEKLLKPAELYLPHYINIGEMPKNQLVHLTASDQAFMEDGQFHFTVSSGVKMEAAPEILKTYCHHFCSHCISIKENAYRTTPKHYMIAMAEKQEDDVTFLDFCCFPCQIHCKQLVTKQYEQEDFNVSNLKSLAFDSNGRLSAVFEPDSIPGWDRDYNGFHTEEILESEMDYYKVIGCEAGNVTKEDIEALQMMEEVLSYPPRFRFKFTCTNKALAQDTTKIKATFNGTAQPLHISVMLKRPHSPESLNVSTLLITPPSSPDIDIKSDPVLMKILTVTADTFCSGGNKWFVFGLKLGLKVSQLHKIELQYNTSTQFAREALLLWRSENMAASWELVANALKSVQLNSVALQLEYQFKEDRPVSIVPSDILEGKPSIADLNNLVGAKIEDKYHLFGVAIGLNEGYLRGLNIDYNMCQERFNQIFYKWSQVDPENFTWKKVIQVLQSDTIRANEVADLVIEHLIGTQ